MEDDRSEGSSFIDAGGEGGARGGIFPVALGIGATAISLFCLWMVLTADTQGVAAREVEPVTARVSELAGEVAQLSDAVTQAEVTRRRNGERVEALRNNMETGFSNLSSAIQENQSRIRQLAQSLQNQADAIEALQETPAPPPNPRPREAAGDGNPGANGGEAAAARPEEGVHIIQPGDTLGAISRRYGVSLDALYEANPGIDPRTLQIGQRVRVPGE